MITYELALVIGFVILCIFIITALLLKFKGIKIVIGALFIAYLTAVAGITLFPIIYDIPIEYSNGVTWYNYIPFNTVISGIQQSGLSTTTVVQFLGNILMAVPYGVFVLIFMRKKRWWKMLLLALMLPIFIESLQLVIGLAISNMYRNVDIDDVILNTVGVYAGYGIYYLIPKKIKNMLSA